MPQISQLPAASSVGAGDLFAIVQSGTTKKASASLVLNYISANITISNANFTGQLDLSHGGTNADLTASNGALVYSTASAFALLPAVVGSTLYYNLAGLPTLTAAMTN